MREDAFENFPRKKVLELSKNFLEGVFKKNRLEIKKRFGFSLR